MEAVNVLIPVKSLHFAKSRLQKQLSAKQRGILVLQMLRHVLLIVKQLTIIKNIFVISADSQVIAFAHNLGVDTFHENIYGQNQALHQAATYVQRSYNFPLLTLSADIPLLQSNDLITMIELLNRSDIVLAPDYTNTGTNAVLFRRPLIIPYLFGKNSLHNYQYTAKKHKLLCNIFRSETIEFDIDTSDDLEKLLQRSPDFLTFI